MRLESNSKALYALERSFLDALGRPEPSFQYINVLATEYQSACRKVILQKESLANEHQVETRFWSSHSKAITCFQTSLRALQGAGGRDVARRKVESQYKKFLRSTSEFYRDLVQGLTSNLGVEGHVPNERQSLCPTKDSEAALSITLCSTSMLRLGDLSRYRNTHLSRKIYGSSTHCEFLKEAESFYSLSSSLNPACGTAHNSLATVARLSNRPVETLLHLHLALLAETPEPMASGNLKVYYVKLLDMHSRGEILPADAHYAPELSADGVNTGFALLMAMIQADPLVEGWTCGLVLDQIKVVFTHLLGLDQEKARMSEIEKLLERCSELCKSADLLREKESRVSSLESDRKPGTENRLKEVEQVLHNLARK